MTFDHTAVPMYALESQVLEQTLNRSVGLVQTPVCFEASSFSTLLHSLVADTVSHTNTRVKPE